jgi:hypothetical protein
MEDTDGTQSWEPDDEHPAGDMQLTTATSFGIRAAALAGLLGSAATATALGVAAVTTSTISITWPSSP